MTRILTPWTKIEIATLQECYPVMSPDDLERKFAPRSFETIRKKANSLNLRKRRSWAAICAQYQPVIFHGGRAT